VALEGLDAPPQGLDLSLERSGVFELAPGARGLE
jgi:hypothetical protein